MQLLDIITLYLMLKGEGGGTVHADLSSSTESTASVRLGVRCKAMVSNISHLLDKSNDVQH